MSDGVVHAGIAIGTEVLLVSGALLFPTDLTLGIALGGVCGILITPDLDHHKKTIEELRWYRVSPILGRLWQTFTAPYDIWFVHRGWSHVHLVGTFTRMTTIGWQFFLYSCPLEIVFKIPTISYWQYLVSLPSMFLIGICLGWSLQDSIHIETDRISSRRKKWKKSSSRRPKSRK